MLRLTYITELFLQVFVAINYDSIFIDSKDCNSKYIDMRICGSDIYWDIGANWSVLNQIEQNRSCNSDLPWLISFIIRGKVRTLRQCYFEYENWLEPREIDLMELEYGGVTHSIEVSDWLMEVDWVNN